MPITEFTPTFRPIVNRIDLEKLGSAYDTLEQGHLKAIDTASAVAGEIAKLDLNEAEDTWRQEQINKIQTAITDNSKYGNAYSALDDVIRTNASIMSDQGMLGRLRAQKDYKDYITNLDARKDIPEDYKAFFKETNTYNYKDIVDDKGKVIGGTKWEPTIKEVSTVPLNEILNNALKWAAKERGGISATRWLDVNGKVTNDITKSVTGEIYSTTTGNWERLSKEKLAEAVKATIESTPGAKASLEQDYRIAKWKYDKNNGINPDITDKNGVLLSPDEYLTKRIDPFYKAATYYNQDTTTKYGDAWKAQLELVRKTAVGTNTNTSNKGIDTLVTTTNPATIENFMPISAQADITSNKQNIANLIKQYNPDLDFNLDNKTNDEIKNLITSTIKNNNDKFNALRSLEIIQDSEEYINSLTKGQNEEDINKFKAYNAIVSLSDIPKEIQNDKDVKNYINVINNLYGSTGKSVRQYFADENIFDEFIAQIGGERKAKSLGVKFGIKDGKKYAELPKEYSNSIYSFATAANNAINSRKFFDKLWQETKSTINYGFGDNIVKVNDKGEENTINRFSNLPANGDIPFKRNIYTQGDDAYKTIIDAVNKLKKTNDKVLQTSNINLGQHTVLQATPNAAEIAFAMKANPEAASKLSTVYKLAEDEAKLATKFIDLTQTGAYAVGDNNVMSNIDSGKRKEYTNILRSGKYQDISISLLQDPKSGRWGPLITINGYYDNEGELKREPITFYAPDGYESDVTDSWNKDTTFRAKNDVNVYSATNRNLSLTNVSAFGGIDKIVMSPQNGQFVITNKSDNKIIGTISNEQAVEYRDMYYRWNDIYNAYNAGIQLNPQAIKAIAKESAANLASIIDNSNNENIIEYYYNQLLSNLNR